MTDRAGIVRHAGGGSLAQTLVSCCLTPFADSVPALMVDSATAERMPAMFQLFGSTSAGPAACMYLWHPTSDRKHVRHASPILSLEILNRANPADLPVDAAARCSAFVVNLQHRRRRYRR